ncbi:MAG: Spy/CpxP family protein refolding chaperone [Steroidobacteraceae bacterium]|jgi:Spy/CpxP family protein refolding chaperone
MFTVRKVVPALCLAVSMSGLAVYVASATASTTPPPAAGPAGHHWRGHHHGGFMHMVLHKLNLTDPQKAQVKSIMAGEKSRFEALRTSSQTNREALASTAPTDTAAYGALIATAQKNAATRIQLMGETWTNIYQNVLTQTQRDAIPGIVAAAKVQHEQRMEQWKAEHSSAESTGQ